MCFKSSPSFDNIKIISINLISYKYHKFKINVPKLRAVKFNLPIFFGNEIKKCKKYFLAKIVYVSEITKCKKYFSVSEITKCKKYF